MTESKSNNNNNTVNNTSWNRRFSSPSWLLFNSTAPEASCGGGGQQWNHQRSGSSSSSGGGGSANRNNADHHISSSSISSLSDGGNNNNNNHNDPTTTTTAMIRTTADASSLVASKVAKIEQKKGNNMTPSTQKKMNNNTSSTNNNGTHSSLNMITTKQRSTTSDNLFSNDYDHDDHDQRKKKGGQETRRSPHHSNAMLSSSRRKEQQQPSKQQKQHQHQNQHHQQRRPRSYPTGQQLGKTGSKIQLSSRCSSPPRSPAPIFPPVAGKNRAAAPKVVVGAIPTRPADSNRQYSHSALSSSTSSSSTSTKAGIALVPPLYRLCAQQHGDISDLCKQGKAYVSIDAARYTNSNGKTALHLLSENEYWAQRVELSLIWNINNSGSGDNIIDSGTTTTTTAASSEEWKDLMKFVIDDLWKAYPIAMMIPDKVNNNIPFESVIRQWIDDMHNDKEENDNSNDSKHANTTKTHTTTVAELLPSKLSSFLMISKNSLSKLVPARSPSDGGKEKQHPSQSSSSSIASSSSSSSSNDVEDVESGSIDDCDSESHEEDDSDRTNNTQRNRTFPVHVKLSNQFVFALRLLSGMIDSIQTTKEISRRRQSIQNSSRSIMRPTSDKNSSEKSTEDLDQSQRAADLQNLTTDGMAVKIVERVASIPDLVKTVLLIEDEEERDWCLSTTIMRHVMVNKHSVGEWLTAMVQSPDRRVSDRGIEYLKRVSSVSVDEKRHDEGHGIAKFQVTHDDENQLHHVVSHLEDFVPSLLSLGTKRIEDAATTRVVQRVLDQIISRPFAVTVVFCDGLFLVILIAGYRGAVDGILLGYSMGTILNFIYVANIGIFYFLIRELGKFVSLCMITDRSRLYLLSFWNLTDILSTFLSLGSTIAIRYYFLSRGSDVQDFSNLRVLFAITTGFLWLRVLSFLKGINMQLATFVLAIIQITRDIVWFCVILLTMVLSFAQIFFTLLAPQSCKASTETDDRACAQSEYYLAVYSIFLGDFGLFDRDNFTSASSVIVAVFYTFMVCLVLFNVLIAVASDSYEKCLLRSQGLFGRSRVMMIAELVCFQALLRRNVQSDGDSVAIPDLLLRSWWSRKTLAGWSRGSVVFFSLSNFVISAWVLGETAGYLTGARHGNFLMSLCSLMINVALFVGIVLFLANGANHAFDSNNDGNNDNGRTKDRRESSSICCGKGFGRFFQSVMLRLLGSSGDSARRCQNGTTYAGSSSSSGHVVDEWRGRLVFLQTEMERLSKDVRNDCNRKVASLEPLIHRSEERLRTEIEIMKEKILNKIDINAG